MKTTLLPSLSLVVSLVLAGCANPINSRTAQQYYEYGVAAERGGDLALAQRNFSRAYGNAKIGNLGPKAEAYYLYEYARVTGYAGNYADSEKAFLDVLALIDKAKGEADKLLPPALSEYSRLLHDIGEHAKAVPIYERAMSELEKVGIESSDPLGYAVLLDDFAESLTAAGLVDRAKAISTQSSSLKAAHQNEAVRFQARRYKK
ncbi:MAG: tetratricopeptide repeat protein [Nibricoccus sp.]